MRRAWNRKIVVFVLFVGIGIVHAQIKVSALAHFVLQQDLALQFPYTDARSVEREPLRLTLRAELVVYRGRCHRGPTPSKMRGWHATSAP